MKKFFTYPVLLFMFLSFIGMMGFGAIIKYHYDGGEKFQFLQKTVIFISSIPKQIKVIIKHKSIDGDYISPLKIDFGESKITHYSNTKSVLKKEELLLVSRFDGDLNKAVVEIRDINNLETLKKWEVNKNLNEILDNTDINNELFKFFRRDRGPTRFYAHHPYVDKDLNLIFHSNNTPLIKVDKNNKLIWVNDDFSFHHSINTTVDENLYYVPVHLNPFSKKVANILGKKKIDISKKINFADDGIALIDDKGKTLFTKSIIEILIEHGYVNRIFAQQQFSENPIHLNDIEPVLKDTPFFRKGDLFLSLRNLSMVILYRPQENKIIKILEGPFANQHDVDILNDEEISIFNNNVLYTYQEKKELEILTYNFKTQSYKKKFQKTIDKYNIDTPTHGLVDFLNDKSAIIDDKKNGRIFYINAEGDLIWKFNNLNKKKELYEFWWVRLINLENSKKIRELIKND